VAGQASAGTGDALVGLRTVLVTTTLEVLFTVIVVVGSTSLEANVSFGTSETAGTVMVVVWVTVTRAVLIGKAVVSGQR
jgi:hypothetical protein